jgi:MATE family multidrug resistance protein
MLQLCCKQYSHATLSASTFLQFSLPCTACYLVSFHALVPLNRTVLYYGGYKLKHFFTPKLLTMTDDMENDTSKPQSWLPQIFRKSKVSEAGSLAPDERTSLLPGAQSEEWSNDEPYELEEETASKVQLLSRELWVLFKGSLPVILAYSLQSSLQTISVLIVGRLSPEALATAAFSYMFAMSTGWLIALGGTTAIDTLASASFTGSKNRHDLGIILQRSFIVLLLFYIPVAILWFCSEPLFKALGQEEYIARDSARFLSVLAPGGIGYVFFEILKKYLQAQGTSNL